MYPFEWGVDLTEKLAKRGRLNFFLFMEGIYGSKNFTHHNGVSFPRHYHFFPAAKNKQEKYTYYNALHFV